MSRIVAVAPALPTHVYPQAEISAEIGGLLTRDPGRRALLDRVHASSGIETRHLALPLEKYAGLSSFGESNDLFLREGAELARRAVLDALDAAGLRPSDVDVLVFTTVTGVSAPSLDALLVEPLGLRPDVRRVPSFGLGCAGGAAGLGIVADHLAAHPDAVAVLLSVELCSLTFQQDDDSTANLVASGLFGDGAAAAVLVGEARAAATGAAGVDGPEVVGARSVLYPGTTGELGWQVGGSGLRIVLSGGMADTVAAHAAGDVAALLAPLGATAADVDRWVVHPGGPKILDAVQESLGLPEDALAVSRATLARTGNLSSAAVLHVLAATEPGPPGGLGVVLAFGPGVGAELVALRWPGRAAA